MNQFTVTLMTESGVNRGVRMEDRQSCASHPAEVLLAKVYDTPRPAPTPLLSSMWHLKGSQKADISSSPCSTPTMSGDPRNDGRPSGLGGGGICVRSLWCPV